MLVVVADRPEQIGDVVVTQAIVGVATDTPNADEPALA
jgi:hypothetical protein